MDRQTAQNCGGQATYGGSQQLREQMGQGRRERGSRLVM